MSRMTKYRYWRCCVNFPTQGPEYDALVAMIDDNIMITRRTFRKHVDTESLAETEQNLGYELHPAKGMTMAGDWHVSYHCSKYKGKTVYYFRHSAIEYIFVPEDFDEH